MKKKINISISLDTKVLAAIKQLAAEDERSVSSYINLILRKHIDPDK